MVLASDFAGLKFPIPERFGTDGFSLALFGTKVSNTKVFCMNFNKKEVKMKIEKKIAGVLLALLCSTNLFAYDADLAKEINKTFSQYSLENLNNSKMLVDSETVMKMLKKGDDFIFLDIRTPNETGILGLRTKNTLEIPFDVLFEKENLDNFLQTNPLSLFVTPGVVHFKQLQVWK